MKIELKLIETDSYAHDTLARIKKNLGTDLIVVGSYVAVGEPQDRKVRLDLRVQDDAGRRNGRVGQRHGRRRRSAGPRVADREPRAERARDDACCRRPSRPVFAPRCRRATDAIRLYAQGLERYRLFDAVGARDLLVQAVAADPVECGRAFGPRGGVVGARLRREGAGGGEARRRAVGRRCRASSGSRSRRGTARWPAIRRRRFRATPSCGSCSPTISITAWTWSRFQTSGGHAKEALATLAKLRKLPPPSGDDPRLDLADASANTSLGNFTQAHAAAMTAAQKGAERGAALLVAEARRLDGVGPLASGEIRRGPRRVRGEPADGARRRRQESRSARAS